MASPVEHGSRVALAAAPPAPSWPAVRGMGGGGERAIARVLRTGALLAGACFAAAISLDVLHATPFQQDAELLREAGAALLVVTPVVRLVVAGVTLGMRGEWRYATYAALILLLLATAAGLGFAH